MNNRQHSPRFLSDKLVIFYVLDHFFVFRWYLHPGPGPDERHTPTTLLPLRFLTLTRFFSLVIYVTRLRNVNAIDPSEDLVLELDGSTNRVSKSSCLKFKDLGFIWIRTSVPILDKQTGVLLSWYSILTVTGHNSAQVLATASPLVRWVLPPPSKLWPVSYSVLRC